MAREALLSRTFVELADTLVDDFDVIDLLTMLSDRCVELLDVTASGIMLADPKGQLHVIAASSEAAHVLELLQLQDREGPCFDCFQGGAAVADEDLERPGRWPAFRQEAVRSGFRSVHALPMRVRDVTLGTLNMFAVHPRALTDDDLTVAKALADAATIAVLHDQVAREARTVTSQLQTALDSRIAIEQAKGVLAERAQVGMDEAFERLRRHARNNNVRLSAVASALVDGSLAPEALASLIGGGASRPVAAP